MKDHEAMATIAWGASGCFIGFATLAGVSGAGWAVPMGVALLLLVASSAYLTVTWWRKRSRTSSPQ